MFDLDTQNSLMLNEPVDDRLSDGAESGDITDITEIMIACTGARDACLLQLQPGGSHRRGYTPPRFGPSAFPKLDQSLKSMQDNIERLLQAEMVDRPSFWLDGADHVLCVPLVIDGELAACMTLSYPAHLLSSESSAFQRRAETIAPLVKTYLQTQKKLAIASRKLSGAMGFLDISHVALILLDNAGGMVLANEAAHATLTAEDGIRLGSWGPVPVALKDASRFQLALEHQVAQNAASRGTTRRSTVLLIQRKKGLRPFVATLIPMPVPATKPGEAAVMLYLFDPSNENFDHLDAISELYGLSKVEARLAHHIALGKTLDEAASAMRIKAPTARTYLKHIFAKTGTHRQIDLARLLMLSTGRLASPDAPDVLR